MAGASDFDATKDRLLLSAIKDITPEHLRVMIKNDENLHLDPKLLQELNANILFRVAMMLGYGKYINLDEVLEWLRTHKHDHFLVVIESADNLRWLDKNVTLLKSELHA